MVFTTNAVPVLKMQNFRSFNRSDMYVPSKIVLSPLKAASIATPYVGRRPVHAVPVMYNKLTTQTIGSRGMATPLQGGVQ